MASTNGSGKGSKEKEALKMEQKKVKVLKKALQEERAGKVAMEKELKFAKDEITTLNNTLADKVSFLAP